MIWKIGLAVAFDIPVITAPVNYRLKIYFWKSAKNDVPLADIWSIKNMQIRYERFVHNFWTQFKGIAV